MTTFYVMAADMIYDVTDEALFEEWFPLHFIHGAQCQFATGLATAQDKYEVLAIILKVQYLLGVVYLLSEADYEDLLENPPVSNDISGSALDRVRGQRFHGPPITAHSWSQRMRLGQEREAVGDELIHVHNNDDTDSNATDEEDFMSIDSDADSDKDGNEDGAQTEVSAGSVESIRNVESLIQHLMDESKRHQLSYVDPSFSEKLNLYILETCNLPASSYAGDLL